MRKILSLLAILSVLLTANSLYAQDINHIKHIFRVYDNKDTKLDFTQTSINAMSGQKIIKNGILTIKPKREMVFDYPDEEIVINDFEVIDYKGSKKYIYKLDGFNKTLFLLFLGKKDVDELFDIKEVNSEFVFSPKYQSNIDRVYAIFDNEQIKELTIVDIYSNQTIYRFNDTSCKRTQKGD
jgi:hypothetical protein